MKIGFGALAVKSHKFCALLYSSHDEMNIKKNKSNILVSYYM